METKTLVNMIFARFMAIYGHKFKSCFETQDEIRIAKREWALSIGGIPETTLVKAVDQCKESLAWMPTISEFLSIINALKPDDGIPEVRDAYAEAARFADHPLQHEWSHPVVYHAGKETGWFKVRGEDEDQVFPVFKYNFDLLARRFREGEVLDDPVPQALENRSEDTLFAFIKHWSQAQSIPEEQAASLLYYLTKPEGSKARQRYRAKAQEKVRIQNLDIVLPDTIEFTS